MDYVRPEVSNLFSLRTTFTIWKMDKSYSCFVTFIFIRYFHPNHWNELVLSGHLQNVGVGCFPSVTCLIFHDFFFTGVGVEHVCLVCLLYQQFLSRGWGCGDDLAWAREERYLHNLSFLASVFVSLALTDSSRWTEKHLLLSSSDSSYSSASMENTDTHLVTILSSSAAADTICLTFYGPGGEFHPPLPKPPSKTRHRRRASLNEASVVAWTVFVRSVKKDGCLRSGF